MSPSRNLVFLFLVSLEASSKVFQPILPLNLEELLIDICLAIFRKFAPFSSAD